MIEFLSEWMRGLILVIFFAVVLDMILPNSTMQRYARLVMGLLIILMMLSPVLKIAKTPVENMDFTLDSLLAGDETDSSGQTMKTLDEILQDGQEMQQQSQQLTVKQWQDGIAEQVKMQIQQDHPVTVDSVEVSIAADEAGRPKDLESLTVTLREQTAPGEVPMIKPVEPVIIGKSGPDEAAPSGKKGTLSQDAQEAAAAIRAQLAAEYKLKTAQIRVVWRES